MSGITWQSEKHIRIEMAHNRVSGVGPACIRMAFQLETWTFT